MIWSLDFTISALPELISHHLPIHIDLGPALKCAPGHKSMEDFSIINSYRFKSGLARSENPQCHCSRLSIRRVHFLENRSWRSAKVKFCRCPGSGMCLKLWSARMQMLNGNSPLPFMAVDVDSGHYIFRDFDSSLQKLCFG